MNASALPHLKWVSSIKGLKSSSLRLYIAFIYECNERLSTGLTKVNVSRLSEQVHISRQGAYNALKDLKKYGLIRNEPDWVACIFLEKIAQAGDNDKLEEANDMMEGENAFFIYEDDKVDKKQPLTDEERIGDFMSKNLTVDPKKCQKIGHFNDLSTGNPLSQITLFVKKFDTFGDRLSKNLTLSEPFCQIFLQWSILTNPLKRNDLSNDTRGFVLRKNAFLRRFSPYIYSYTITKKIIDILTNLSPFGDFNAMLAKADTLLDKKESNDNPDLIFTFDKHLDIVPDKLMGIKGFNEAYDAWIEHLQANGKRTNVQNAKEDFELLSHEAHPVDTIKTCIRNRWLNLRSIITEEAQKAQTQILNNMEIL